MHVYQLNGTQRSVLLISVLIIEVLVVEVLVMDIEFLGVGNH